ncbi:hypothetical protein KVK50_07195 [Helicobacter pylori]|nr:hypothetical protein KVK50_07195 [Helicobacter pylori]
MLLDCSNLNEEPLKSIVAKAFFENFDFSGDKIDFIITYSHKNKGKPLWIEPILWAEGKKGKSELFKSLAQLILTIGKHKFYTHFPPPYLGAFDAFSFLFVEYHKLDFIFTRSDIDFSVTPSNHNTESFKHLLNELTPLLEKEALIFDYETQNKELKAFIKDNLLYSKRSKIPVDKNNFVHVYFKWVEHVKPSISIEWQQAKKQGILDADFYLADLLSESNETILESLNTILKVNHYKFNKKLNNFGAFNFDETSFNDKQKAHKTFWNIYERPPKREFWDYIIQRRDLLVPSDVRERKGAFFTPKIWVEKSQEYLAKALGQDYQEDYIIWDCAGGTGNLLNGLTNKANCFLSTLDSNDVAIVKDLAAKNHLKLLENHVFQFDFLNDDFKSDKMPKSLQEILKDKEKRKKLIIYINPPYAEAGNKAKMSGTGEHKAKVARDNLICEKYKNELGKANNEVFAQFFMRIYRELNGCIMASFSKLKYLNSSNFKKFREVFKAKFLEGFMVPADSFDNVNGQFPIGFLVWDTATPPPPLKPTNALNLEMFDSRGGFLGYKNIVNENVKNINEWFKTYKDKQDYLGILVYDAPDFSHQNTNYLQNHKGTSHLHYENLTLTNLLIGAIYFSIRHCIKATWQNDRDQFYAPYDDAFQDDSEFKNNCLIFMLFHTQNRITATQGTNHFIPFSEDEVKSKDSYTSHVLLDFLKGKTKKTKEYGDSLFLNAKKENKLLEFSLSTLKVFDAGREVYRHYHTQDFTNRPYNANASLYDIKEFFQGRNMQGKLNSPAKAKDKYYKQLYANLQDALKDLAKEIQPKVYEYGFLRE